LSGRSYLIVLRLVPVRASILAALSAAVLAVVLAAGFGAEGAAAASPKPLPWRPGAPVLGFGDGGKVRLAPPVGKPTFRERIAVDAQGRVLLLTVTKESGSFLTRLLPDGAVDPEFAAGGWVAAPEGEWDEMALDGAGRILLSGSVKGDLAVTRLMPDGTPDPTFGTGGVARLHVGRPALEGVGGEELTRLAPLPDGSVVAAGIACSTTCYPTSGVAVKFTPDGAPDPSFGEGGVALLIPLAPPDLGRGKGILRSVSALSVQSDGKILVGGSDYRSVVVVRLTAAGAVDPSFADKGTFFTTRETSGEEDAVFYPGSVRALLVERSGRIVVVGERLVYGLRPNGRIDPRFGYPGSESNFKGIGTIAPQGGGGVGSAQDALLDGAGRIVVVGNIGGGAGISRLLADGRSDPRFGGGGLMYLRVGNSPPPPETNYSEPLASVAQLPGGDLVAAGYGYFDRHDPRPNAVVLRRNNRTGRFAHCAGSLATYQGTPRPDGLGWIFGTLVTFGGNDKIAGAGGAVCTGSGDDTVLNRTNWSEPIYLGPGDDRSIGSTGRIFGGPGNDRIALGKYSEGPLVANGGPGRDTLVGSDEGNRLEGGPGDDVLIGGAGRDVLIGGPGNDVLIGSKGDVFRPGPGRNRIIIRP
jgi:uncharacterized delta-60 repeat protein